MSLTVTRALQDENERLHAKNKIMREALEWIAKQDTSQNASPTQCAMVAVAMEALD